MSPARDQSARAERVRAVVAAARRLADPDDELGRHARAALPSVTGLSAQGVELGLTRHLETEVSDEHLARLLELAAPAPRVQVVLSANVFVAAVRAVALAVGASAHVVLRPSSREPIVAELLARALSSGPASVILGRERELAMRAGDQVHVYGRRETIDAVIAVRPSGVLVLGHGPGCGAALVDAAGVDLAQAAHDLSWDVVPFDQRGCLSPRIALVKGSADEAERFALELCDALDARARVVPRGELQDDELAGQAWYRRAVQATGTLRERLSHLVGCDVEGRALIMPPTGRCVHVVRVSALDHLRALLGPLAPSLTCLGVAADGALLAVTRELAPAARLSALGQMQRPPLDGPVDLRGVV